MGRKSVADERRQEILAAFERCIVKFGLEGSTLERIAEEAGLRRSLIRHYIGNRDELVDELIERTVENYLAEAAAEFEGVADENYVAVLLDSLFKAEIHYTPADQIVIAILMTAKERYPKARQLLTEMFTTLVESLAGDLKRIYPYAESHACVDVAYALLNLSMNHESMLWLGMNPDYTQAARHSAEILLASLAN